MLIWDKDVTQLVGRTWWTWGQGQAAHLSVSSITKQVQCESQVSHNAALKLYRKQAPDHQQRKHHHVLAYMDQRSLQISWSGISTAPGCTWHTFPVREDNPYNANYLLERANFAFVFKLLRTAVTTEYVQTRQFRTRSFEFEAHLLQTSIKSWASLQIQTTLICNTGPE